MQFMHDARRFDLAHPEEQASFIDARAPFDPI
jgi:hypothetical protein